MRFKSVQKLYKNQQLYQTDTPAAALFLIEWNLQ